MSQLILLRNRIKTVSTIKKTTNAMRLISMSAHSRLRQQKNSLATYKTEIQRLLEKLIQAVGSTTDCYQAKNPQQLIILVGSQKGLCGSFNGQLFSFFKKTILPSAATTLITVGAHAHSLSITHHLQPKASYNNFTSSTFITIADQLVKEIIATGYASAQAISMVSKSFFIQRPTMTQVLTPLIIPPLLSTDAGDIEWEISPKELLPQVFQLQLKSIVQEVLFESLLAEQSARFVSMDTATQNAESLLNDMRRDYNKLRQALITRELADLTGSLLL